LTRLKIALASD